MSETRVIAGRYELRDLIGRGGMGDVYRGLDQHTGDPVAIKLLHPDVLAENPQLVDRFQREGEALRKLNHPNIVKILATVEENGQHYLVMEYVGGGSLRDLMDEYGQLPIQNILEVALDLADALTRAHRLHIIHRDIKPDNVLLAEDGTPRLTDFGVAHIEDRTRLTQTGAVIGTYGYLSPEACNGLELDERADIWSFGVMLYEMLAGRPPFKENGTAAILTAILTKPFPDITEFRPDAPPALVNLINSMLEKDRDQRINSVRVIGAELEALIRGLDTPLRGLLGVPDPQAESSRFATPSDQGTLQPTPESCLPAPIYITTPYPPPRSDKWKWITISVGIIAVTCLALAVATFVFGAFSQKQQTRRESTQTAAAVPALTTPTIVPVASGEYMVLLADLEQLGTTENPNARRFIKDSLAQALEVNVPLSNIRVRDYAGVITSGDQARAVAETSGATVIIWGGYTDNYIELDVQVGVTSAFPHMQMPRAKLEQAANVRVRLTDPRVQSVAPMVLGVLTVMQCGDGDGYEFMRTMAIMEELDVPSAEIVGDTFAAHVHWSIGAFFNNPEMALKEIDAALTIDATNPIVYGWRGVIYHRQGKVVEATRDAETAGRLGPQNWTVPYYLLGMGTNSIPETLAYYDRIIELRPDDWFPVNFRGTLYYLMHQNEQAKADLEKAIALGPNANFPYVFAALIAIEEGRIPDAGSYMQVILEKYPDPTLYNRIMTATFGEEFDVIGSIVSAFVNLLIGRYEETVTSTDLALKMMGPMIDLYIMKGYAHCNLAQYKEAEEAYTNAIVLLPARHEAGFDYLLRAEVRLKQGHREDAADDFARAAEGFGDGGVWLVEGFQNGDIGCRNMFGSMASRLVLN